MAERIDPPQLILTSPLVRPRQTPKLATEIFGVNMDTWSLLSENVADTILAVLGKLSQLHAAMLVGQGPSLSELIEKLCQAAPGTIHLKKAGCAALAVTFEFGERPGAPATLLWLATPEVLV